MSENCINLVYFQKCTARQFFSNNPIRFIFFLFYLQLVVYYEADNNISNDYII